jgi:hypothetical protein
MYRRLLVFSLIYFHYLFSAAQSYPQNYFRHPLDIPMQLVANFGEIRTNHWHMGLDIRTQQRVNLPVHAAADGYIARVSIEPGGFGQAIYINHPNGYTTVYGHLNSFFSALADYVKQEQYQRESWNVNLILPAHLFPVKKGDVIALSGSTGASEGPHVHFEIRDTESENCLNPLLFKFPIADAVPPTVTRLALYDKNKSTWQQVPQFLALKKAGNIYTIPGNLIRVGSDKISFAIGAFDRLSGTNNPNGIFSAKIIADDHAVSEFILDNISYDDTRYINAQLDYSYKSKTGASLQHITPLPGAGEVAYNLFDGDGVIRLTDTARHEILIEVKDANGNSASIRFNIQFDPNLKKIGLVNDQEKFLPNNVNIFERENFELFTTEKSIYDTAVINYTETNTTDPGAVSAVFTFLNKAVPSHDSFTVRVKPAENISAEWNDRVVIKNICGERTFLEKAVWQKGWYAATFRQFGTFQAFVDTEPPTINSPALNLSKSNRIVFIPRDNFNVIKSFRAELDNHWLRFSNDKGKSWIYTFDEHFTKGQHELKVTIEDEAGNTTTKVWNVIR